MQRLITIALLCLLAGCGRSETEPPVAPDTPAAAEAPTAEELAHDYLWRIHRAVPRKGIISPSHPPR